MINANAGTTHAGKTFDKNLEIVASGTALTTGTGTSGIYIGTGLVEATIAVDLETVTGTDNGITLQFSEKADFSAPVSGASATFTAGQTGRVIVPFRNDPAGKPLAYVRIMPKVGTALKLGAFIAK